MNDERCATCKHWSGLNGWCDVEQRNTDADYKCFKYREYKKKCEDCTNDACDGNCDCDGDCKDKDKSSGGCSSGGGCGGCSGNCTSLSVGINRLATIDISSPANYKWEYLLEDGKDQELGKIEVKVYSHNTTQYQHYIDATMGSSILMKNFIFSTHKDEGYLEIENNSGAAKITIKRI